MIPAVKEEDSSAIFLKGYKHLCVCIGEKD